MVSATSINRCTVALSLLVGIATGERTFIDSKDDVFTIADDAPPPKIVINAAGALSLFHLGAFVGKCHRRIRALMRENAKCFRRREISARPFR